MDVIKLVASMRSISRRMLVVSGNTFKLSRQIERENKNEKVKKKINIYPSMLISSDEISCAM